MQYPLLYNLTVTLVFIIMSLNFTTGDTCTWVLGYLGTNLSDMEYTTNHLKIIYANFYKTKFC